MYKYGVKFYKNGKEIKLEEIPDDYVSGIMKICKDEIDSSEIKNAIRELSVVLARTQKEDIINTTTITVKSLDTAIKALERQTPKLSNCKICDDTSNSRYYRNQGYKHCPHCGQKLEY